MDVWPLYSCLASHATSHTWAPHFETGISTFTRSAAHQCQLQSSGPIRRLQRRGKHCKILFKLASCQCNILFDRNMAEEAFCLALKKKKKHSWVLCLTFLDAKIHSVQTDTNCQIWTLQKKIFLVALGVVMSQTEVESVVKVSLSTSHLRN